MALFHLATIAPTKEELIAEWAPRQPWGPTDDVPMTVIGSYRFDDPDGKVGMETFLAQAGDEFFQIPLTYRDAPVEGAVMPAWAVTGAAFHKLPKRSSSVESSSQAAP